MVPPVSLSKQLATGSNDSMVFVWNLNTTGNIYKYIGHRVPLLSLRMQLPTLNSHHWAINWPVRRKIRLLRFGPITQREIPLPSRHTTRQSVPSITATMENCCSLVRMIRPSRCIASKIGSSTSPSLAIRIGSRPPISHQTIDWSAQEARIRQSSSGIRSHRRYSISSMITWEPSMTVNSIQTAHVWPVARRIRRWNFMTSVVRDWSKITMPMVSQWLRWISIPKTTSWSPLLSIPRSKFGKSTRESSSIPSMATMAAPMPVPSPNMEIILPLEAAIPWPWSGRLTSKANRQNSYMSLMVPRRSLFPRSKVPTNWRMQQAGSSRIRTKREKAQEMCWRNKRKGNHLKTRSKFPVKCNKSWIRYQNNWT